MKFPKELTTATPISKYLAMLVFIALPIVGFFFGMRYQEMLDFANRHQIEPNLSIPRTPTPAPNETANWKTYHGNSYSFKYPYSWSQKENTDFQKPNIIPDALEVKVSISNSQSFLLGATDYPKDGCRVDLLIADTGKNPAQLIKDERYKSIDSLSSPTKESPVIINGAMGIKRDYLPDNKANSVYASVILLPGKQNIFAFYLMKGHKVLDTSCEGTLDQILSTFQFLP